MSRPANDFVRRSRMELRMSQAALAKVLGITRKTVMRYENNSPVPARSLIAIMALLNRRGIKDVPKIALLTFMGDLFLDALI